MNEQNKPQRSGYSPIGQAEPPMSAQQLQAIQKDMAARLTAITKDVELRKWAIDQACSIANTVNELPDGKVTFHDPIALAREIHKFLTEGATEAK